MRGKRFTTENENNGTLYVNITYPGEVVVRIHKCGVTRKEDTPEWKLLQNMGLDLGTNIDIQSATDDDEPYLASEDM